MSQMTEQELLMQVQMAETDAITHSNAYMPLNRQMMEYYLSRPNGYEVEGQSQVTSTEVQDVVGSDMPGLVRSFLGGADIVKFKPNTEEELDVQEANEKTKYTHHIVRSQPSAFTIMHGFLKNVEIQSAGILHYPWKETKTTETRNYKGVDEDEWTDIFIDLEIEKDRQGFEFEITTDKDNADGTKDIQFKITRIKKGVCLENISIEQMRISSNAVTKDDADLIGHEFMARRGDLVADGFDEEKLKTVPKSSSRNDSGMAGLRFSNSGNNDHSPINNPASDLLRVSNLHMKIDFDGDGIPERRHIIKIGDVIFSNEPFDHVPYAIASAILMPGTLLGRSRAEITMQSQLLGTEIMRSTMDNIYDVSAGRVAVNDNVDMDSLLTNRNTGVVSFEGTGDVRASIAQLETPFVGDKTLLVIQYLDTRRAASTGEMLANQGLEADQIYNETAARFNGMRDAGAAKLELVGRVIAETGIKDLFQGIAWTVSHYQSSKDEIMVLGKQLSVNPSRWWNQHSVEAQVGEGAGDNSETIGNLSGIFQIQNQLKGENSSLVDDRDRFNTLKRLLAAMGENNVDQFFNDPVKPEQSAQFLLEQNNQLMQQMQQLMQQNANPLLEPEKIKAEASLIKAQTDNQVKIMQTQAKAQLDMAKMQEDQRQFNEKQETEFNKKLLEIEAKNNELEFKYIQLETEFKTDIPGKGA